MMLVSICTFSQIQVLETKAPVTIGKVGSFGDIVSLECIKGDEGINSYCLTYRNIEYRYIIDLKNVLFEATEEELNSLYDLINSRFSKESNKNDEYKNVILGKSIIKIPTATPLSFLWIAVIYNGGGTGYFKINKRQLDILFGKLVKK